ncbi:MAG: oxidoreductase [Planctomycetes bacterium]|jgi:3-oxoacyl-[acyl-carrier protein] reductase|nr:oxidoreductase [Planctomycetota bacterium]
MAEARVILITGARKGIGRALAEHYCGRGDRVVGCSRKAVDFELEGYEHHRLDVADEAAVHELFQAVRTNHGRLDGLINNAGVASMNHVLLTPLDTVRRIIETNLVGTFLFCREAARLMRTSGGGRIVNLTTVAARLHLEGEAVYAASKAAVESLTVTLAHELASMNITVNAVGPTPIETDLVRNVPREKLEAIVARQAIQRFGELRDVLNVVDFFMDPASDFVTGQVLYLGGV